MDVGNFVRHLCVLVLRHQMRVSNYFVNSFYSVVGLQLQTLKNKNQDSESLWGKERVRKNDRKTKERERRWVADGCCWYAWERNLEDYYYFTSTGCVSEGGKGGRAVA